MPAHDAYSLAKVLAARPIANRVYIQLVGASPSTQFSLKFNQAVVNS